MKNIEEDYVKIVYQSEPIGPEKIILYLTTFDTEAFEKDKKMKEIPKKKRIEVIEVDKGVYKEKEYFDHITEILNNRIDDFYKREINKLKASYELNRKTITIQEVQPSKIIKGNIVNTETVECDVIKGNVVNCDNVKCNKIEGKMINCN